MLSARHVRLYAGLALCLVALLAACGPQTATTESLAQTAEPADTSLPPTTATLEEASPTPPLDAPASPAPRPTASPEPTAGLPPVRLTDVLPVVPLPVPTSGPGLITAEVPQALLDAILADAEVRSGVPGEQLTLLRAEAVTWRDGSLGCPQPGMMYTQALVPGYWVVLEANGQELDYSASTGGYFFLCEDPLLRQEPLPGGGSE